MCSAGSVREAPEGKKGVKGKPDLVWLTSVAASAAIDSRVVLAFSISSSIPPENSSTCARMDKRKKRLPHLGKRSKASERSTQRSGDLSPPWSRPTGLEIL